jgi:hypothetical protein
MKWICHSIFWFLYTKHGSHNIRRHLSCFFLIKYIELTVLKWVLDSLREILHLSDVQSYMTRIHWPAANIIFSLCEDISLRDQAFPRTILAAALFYSFAVLFRASLCLSDWLSCNPNNFWKHDPSLVSLRLVSSRLVSCHLISSHLVSYRLVSLLLIFSVRWAILKILEILHPALVLETAFFSTICLPPRSFAVPDSQTMAIQTRNAQNNHAVSS